MTPRLWTLAVAASAALLSRAAAADDLVETATKANFKTLVAAVEAAGLADALKGPGPFTVFAPTDEAFAALPAGTLESLLLPENKAKLQEILGHHVVPGRLMSYEVGNIDMPQIARTIAGDRESIAADRRGFRFGAAQVTKPDIACSNGVIHVIDRVVLPKPQRSADTMTMEMKDGTPTSLLAALRAVPDGRFSTFVAAVEASGADQDWAKAEPDGNWTIFVPTNDAFARLPDAERAALLDPRNRESLRALLDWHALPELQAWSYDFNDRQRGPTMVSREKGRFVIDILCNGLVFVYTLRQERDRAKEEPFKARILAGDIQVGGNVVHVVDRIIVPQAMEGRVLTRQAYREPDVEELTAGAESMFNAVYVLSDLLAKGDALDDAGAEALYEFGLRIADDVIPMSRTGMLMVPEIGSTKREQLRNKLRSRVGDLDRVWYGMFMKNSPAPATLDGSLPVPATPAPPAAPKSAAAAAAAPVIMPVVVDAKAVEAAATSAPAAIATSGAPTLPVRVPLAWCEVLERDVDPAVVTDPALREAIAKTGLPWRVQDKQTGIEMLLVPPGQFRMGRSEGDPNAYANEVPAHAVTVSQPYYLGRYEVTQAQWTKAVGAKKPAPKDDDGDAPAGIVIRGRAEFVDQQGNPIGGTVTTTTTAADGTVTMTATAGGDEEEPTDARPDVPAVGSWLACADFCRSAGMRLPTEAEWEFACRAGTTGPVYGALDDIAWHRGNAAGTSNPVGRKAANALGFHDMIGNSWEWVNDWFADYTRSAKVDPTGPASGTSKIARGSFFNFDAPKFCRASLRYSINSIDFGRIGFRVARNP
jgi:uncharacterized surface protein with fasciclin (FAS1) repeats/formylglycine-generating enzyme required for sulfatase activity